MSTLKKILSLSLALAMLMSVSVFAGFADAADIDEDAAAAVELLAAVKILNGIPQEDGTVDFAPAATIKRAEAAKMIYVLRNGGVDDGAKNWKGIASFEDCKDHWANGYIAYCEAYGIINGRTETVFDPEAPVTGVELAKMLLTVAGYKSDVEGFTGTGWEKRVIAEANAAGKAGLFNGTDFAITTAAPRQWAAVMFVNAFEVEVPTYIGDYRVDASILGKDAKVETVAEKFLDYDDTRVTYVIATETATLNGTFAKKGEVVLADDKTETFAVADALVGQQVKVTTIDGKIVSIDATGKSLVGTLTAVAHTGTDAGKYTVKVGDTVVLDKKADATIRGSLTASALATEQAKKGVYTTYTAYDIEGDKAVDWVVKTTTTYGKVTVATDKSFTVGSFAVDKDGKTTVGETKVAVAVEGTMKTGIVAKVVYDELTGKYTVAPAEVVIGVLTGRTGTEETGYKYTVGGQQYEISDNALTGETGFLSTANLKKTAVLYTDGTYVVLAKEFVEETVTPDAPTELPSKLAMLLSAKTVTETTYGTNDWGEETKTETEVLKVEVLLADGTKIILPYETAKALVKDTNVAAGDVAKYVGGIFEYTITANAKILFNKALPAVDTIVYFGTNENGAFGADVTYNTTSKLLEGITGKFILGTENTKVFVEYKNTTGTTAKTEYKVMTVADLAAYKIEELKLIAATKANIGEGLLATAKITDKATTPSTTPVAHYVVATSDVDFIVDGTKIYMTFTAIDLKNDCAEDIFKAEVKTTGTADLSDVKKGAVLTLETTDDLVTSAVAEEWTKASIQAKAGNLLLVNGTDIWQTSGTENKFASNCKIIVKNGDTYVTGTIDNLVVAKKTGTEFNKNIEYVLGTGTNAAKIAYVIIDLAK